MNNSMNNSIRNYSIYNYSIRNSIRKDIRYNMEYIYVFSLDIPT